MDGCMILSPFIAPRADPQALSRPPYPAAHVDQLRQPSCSRISVRVRFACVSD